MKVVRIVIMDLETGLLCGYELVLCSCNREAYKKVLAIRPSKAVSYGGTLREETTPEEWWILCEGQVMPLIIAD